MVNFRYNSDVELPFHHWWWSSIITVMWTSVIPVAVISVICILRVFRLFANATFIIACHVKKDLEDWRKPASSGMVQQKNTSRLHKRLKYPVLFDSQLRCETGKTQTADDHHDERSVRIAYWSTQRLSKRTVYRRQTFRRVLWRVWWLLT